MTDQPRVQVYMTKTCPFCLGAVALLQDRDIDFAPTYLDGHPNRRQATAEILPGHTTVPLILIDGKPIGGFTELQQLDARGELTKLASSPS